MSETFPEMSSLKKRDKIQHIREAGRSESSFVTIRKRIHTISLPERLLKASDNGSRTTDPGQRNTHRPTRQRGELDRMHRPTSPFRELDQFNSPNGRFGSSKLSNSSVRRVGPTMPSNSPIWRVGLVKRAHLARWTSQTRPFGAVD